MDCFNQCVVCVFSGACFHLCLYFYGGRLYVCFAAFRIGRISDETVQTGVLGRRALSGVQYGNVSGVSFRLYASLPVRIGTEVYGRRKPERKSVLCFPVSGYGCDRRKPVLCNFADFTESGRKSAGYVSGNQRYDVGRRRQSDSYYPEYV